MTLGTFQKLFKVTLDYLSLLGRAGEGTHIEALLGFGPMLKLATVHSDCFEVPSFALRPFEVFPDVDSFERHRAINDNCFLSCIERTSRVRIK